MCIFQFSDIHHTLRIISLLSFIGSFMSVRYLTYRMLADMTLVVVSMTGSTSLQILSKVWLPVSKFDPTAYLGNIHLESFTGKQGTYLDILQGFVRWRRRRGFESLSHPLYRTHVDVLNKSVL